MITLWELGVRSELFALIFKLNEEAKIQVKTPFSLTNPFECSRIVKQGSVLSSNLCSASTAQVCDYFMLMTQPISTTTSMRLICRIRKWLTSQNANDLQLTTPNVLFLPSIKSGIIVLPH